MTFGWWCSVHRFEAENVSLSIPPNGLQDSPLADKNHIQDHKPEQGEGAVYR